MPSCIDCGFYTPKDQPRCDDCARRAGGIPPRHFRKCLTCGEVAAPKKKSLPVWLGILLLLLYIIPGLIYFAIAAFTSKDVCPRCGGTQLVPADTSTLSPVAAASGVRQERINCRECGESIPLAARACRFCGTPLVHGS